MHSEKPVEWCTPEACGSIIKHQLVGVSANGDVANIRNQDGSFTLYYSVGYLMREAERAKA